MLERGQDPFLFVLGSILDQFRDRVWLFLGPKRGGGMYPRNAPWSALLRVKAIPAAIYFGGFAALVRWSRASDWVPKPPLR